MFLIFLMPKTTAFDKRSNDMFWQDAGARDKVKGSCYSVVIIHPLGGTNQKASKNDDTINNNAIKNVIGDFQTGSGVSVSFDFPDPYRPPALFNICRHISKYVFDLLTTLHPDFQYLSHLLLTFRLNSLLMSFLFSNLLTTSGQIQHFKEISIFLFVSNNLSIDACSGIYGLQGVLKQPQNSSLFKP